VAANAANDQERTADDEDASEERLTESSAEEQTEDALETISEEVQEAEVVFVEKTTEAPVYIDIVAVGDNLIHKEIDVTVQREDGSYYFDDIYAPVKSIISSADLAILNQEVPCAGDQYEIKGYPTFNAPTEVLDTAARLGFDVLTLGTNHALDMGEAGLVNTLDYLHTNYPDILTTGTASNYEEYMTIPIIEVQGVKIAVLNYTYGTNDIPLPNDYSVNLLSDRSKIADDISRAKEQADFVIVAPHWGNEYEQEPSTEQRSMAYFFANCGADLIIGTHPHVVQPMEWITCTDGRQVLVYYSLGNFVSAQAAVPRALGGMARVTLEVSNGEVQICYNTLDFTVTYFTAENWTFDNFKVYMLRDFPKRRLNSYGIYTWVPDFSFQDFLDIAYQMNPDWQ
jgi:poly-gamma-glutamate synthesis protein (capsule biosynthesis protein)